MIFEETHNQERQLIRPNLNALFELASKNQTHPSDLFLVVHQGYYEQRLEGNDLNLSKYVLGLPGEPGWEYWTAYNFINEYRKANLGSLEEYNNYKSSIAGDGIKQRELLNDESISVQIEQLVYLKFWESNFIIRQLYQLARLACGEDYDWDFTLKKKNRKKVLVNSIRNKIEPFNKSFTELFDSVYSSQIRNAIAHSMFFFIGDTIKFTNHGHNQGDDISSLTFEQWRPYIHKTLVIFDEFIRLRDEVDKYYRGVVTSGKNKLEFRLRTATHDEIRTIEHFPGEMNAWGNIELMDKTQNSLVR